MIFLPGIFRQGRIHVRKFGIDMSEKHVLQTVVLSLLSQKEGPEHNVELLDPLAVSCWHTRTSDLIIRGVKI